MATKNVLLKDGDTGLYPQTTFNNVLTSSGGSNLDTTLSNYMQKSGGTFSGGVVFNSTASMASTLSTSASGNTLATCEWTIDKIGSAGGGDVTKAGNNTFTGSNTFSGGVVLGSSATVTMTSTVGSNAVVNSAFVSSYVAEHGGGTGGGDVYKNSANVFTNSNTFSGGIVKGAKLVGSWPSGTITSDSIINAEYVDDSLNSYIKKNEGEYWSCFDGTSSFILKDVPDVKLPESGCYLGAGTEDGDRVANRAYVDSHAGGDVSTSKSNTFSAGYTQTFNGGVVFSGTVKMGTLNMLGYEEI